MHMWFDAKLDQKILDGIYYKVDKDLELKEFRIDSNGKKSKKSYKSLKKLEIKRLPTSDGELVKKNNVKRQQECAIKIIFQLHYGN